MLLASSNRSVSPPEYFDCTDPVIWEQLYQAVMDPKYSKNTRKFSTTTTVAPKDNPRLYVIPRIRAGPSYLTMPLSDDHHSELHYCPISKGFSMQDVSSFTLGPIIGEGLCLVNSAFSKSITVAHIEGGGTLNLNRKNFWQRKRTPLRQIIVIDSEYMMVDGIHHNIMMWLNQNEQLWYNEWDRWRRSIALCSRGDFHWTDNMGETIAYHNNKNMVNKYIDFVTWKKQCYIKPSYELLPQTSVFQFLQKLYDQRIPIGLVHPKGFDEAVITPITSEYITQLFNDPNIMCCQPYVVAGKLLNINLY
jgi:hypothetical protein